MMSSEEFIEDGELAYIRRSSRRLRVMTEPLFDSTDVRERCEAVATMAVESIADVEAAEVCFTSSDDVNHVLVGRGSLPPGCHSLQHELGVGACPETTQGEQDTCLFLVADRLAGTDEERRYAQTLRDSGIAMQYGVRMKPRRRTLGSFTIYSAARSTVSERLALSADAFARLLELAIYLSEVRDMVEVGMKGRTTIGAAIGLTMARFDLDEEGAHQYLKRISNDTNVKVRDLSRTVIDQFTTGLPHPRVEQ